MRMKCDTMKQHNGTEIASRKMHAYFRIIFFICSSHWWSCVYTLCPLFSWTAKAKTETEKREKKQYKNQMKHARNVINKKWNANIWNHQIRLSDFDLRSFCSRCCIREKILWSHLLKGVIFRWLYLICMSMFVFFYFHSFKSNKC